MINWTLQKFKVSALKEYAKNPRKLSKNDYEQLSTSISTFGLIDKPIVTKAGQIIGGHQRKKILQKLNIKEVDCWVPDVELDEKQVEELCIRLNKNVGEWDFDLLANSFNELDLLNWGFTHAEFNMGDQGNIKEEEIFLPDEEKGLCVASFTLTDDQKETVEKAIAKAKKGGDLDYPGNENSNGNALYKICCEYLLDE